VQFNISKDSFKLVKDKTVSLDNGRVDPAALKNLITKQGVTKANLIGCLFRHQVSVRFFSFPSHDDAEIARMVKFEAADLLPLKPDETITRYLVLRKRNNGYSDTLVVVTHKQEVQKLVDKLHSAGLQCESLNLSSLALLVCLRAMAKQNIYDPKENVLLVYLEDQAVEIIIAKNGIIEFSRGFLADDQKKMPQALISEIRHSMELFFNNSGDTQLKKIILASPDEQFKPMLSAIKDRFAVPISEQKMDIAYGLALLAGKGVNLLTNEFMFKKMMKSLKNKLLAGCLLLLLNFFIIGSIFITNLHFKQEHIRKLDGQIKKLKPQAEIIENKLRKLEIVQKQLSTQILILDSITDIVDLCPVSANLNMLSINEQGVMVIKGQAQSLQEVLDFVAALENSQHFINSHLNYSSRRKTQKKELIDFEIQAKLEQKGR
jgi:Tfp pilus assembly protein PilN